MNTKQTLTYEDYLALPETMQRYEIIDGELIMAPAPLFGHQWRSKKIFQPLDAYVEENQLGLVVYAPVDIMINKDPLRTRQPDVLYISVERLEKYNLDEMEELPFLNVAPELVVELISPSESRSKIEDKLADYQQIGVCECWLVRSTEGTIEVVRFTADSSQTVERFRRGERVRSDILPGWQPAVDDLLVPLTPLKTRK
ncbi:Uma2 family endonuclease [Candidatus Poribacteria bacterium]|nr:Uma2 family endonuclease [Candidatus Poribacteria bacterium]